MRAPAAAISACLAVWPAPAWSQEKLAARFAPPAGYARVKAAAGSFGAWLRELPVKPGRPPVRLYDGRMKGNQSAHEAVVDIDVGRQDLQQCADAVIRLRAEYLFARGREADICFRFTSGHLAEWLRWREGWRPLVTGNRVEWRQRASPDGSYGSFRRYLDAVFRYAGSASLSRELKRVADPAEMEIGDVFIQGGSPGHAVLVLDLAEAAGGRKVFLLGQSYMPAQEFHVLKNPSSGPGPWYELPRRGPLVTPEWVFPEGSLKRFQERGCGRD